MQEIHDGLWGSTDQEVFTFGRGSGRCAGFVGAAGSVEETEQILLRGMAASGWDLVEQTAEDYGGVVLDAYYFERAEQDVVAVMRVGDDGHEVVVDVLP